MRHISQQQQRRLATGTGLRRQAPSVPPEPATPEVRRKVPPTRRWWKRAMAISLLPAAGAGGYVSQAAIPAVTVVPTRTVTSMPLTPPTLFHMDAARMASGGEYLLNTGWQELAAAHGRQAAEHRAGAVVEVARRCAGGGTLTPELRHYLIRMVLSGVGGLNPDEAADILELSTDSQNDPLLEPLIKVIEDESALGLSTSFRREPPVPPS
jgi:hypothetical protein